jgi:hypothetical protein
MILDIDRVFSVDDMGALRKEAAMGRDEAVA